MKQTRIEKAIETLKQVNFSWYWIESLVRLGDITESEAGYIITYYRKG